MSTSMGGSVGFDSSNGVSDKRDSDIDACGVSQTTAAPSIHTDSQPIKNEPGTSGASNDEASKEQPLCMSASKTSLKGEKDLDDSSISEWWKIELDRLEYV